ncbi:hypothetical protein DEU38_13427 [Rhodococcus sp. AG1013]|uniref:hypothetical protein n=1 Tax=Rhodococcus sp. AG1013 TaxID=2183996 RepID=UPI000E0B0A73|nr:hypothetical protein [Rhodococcus sp. AG1013]RDI13452.1 hypothetical protein DEU38_13427 [Rhodococcus sp. AG1013]
MSETVVRIRKSPGGIDSNNDPIPSSVERTAMRVKAVSPGVSKRNSGVARNGETIEYTLYFTPAPDLTNDDEIEVRGLVCKARVLDWRSAFGTGRRGLEVLAVTSRG